MTTTVLGARLSISETRQSSDIDQSNGAYYAAEAGVEEASRRLDANEDQHATLDELFPRQRDGAGCDNTLHGDRAVLINDSGSSSLGGGFNIQPDCRDQHGNTYGRLAWRQRRVYEEPTAPSGTLVKDETTELDMTELRRDCADGTQAGENDKDCDDHDPIFDRLDAMRFCWTPRPEEADMEFTVLSYPEDTPENVDTDKFVTSGLSAPKTADHVRLAESDRQGGYQYCAELQGTSGGDLNENRRYIVRVRPLFPQLTSPGAGRDASNYKVDYQTKLIDNTTGLPNQLFIPDDTVLIDVVGQSGDVRRRIIARKQRQGRILGIFDYVLYSGSDDLPLCKVGVQQSDVGYGFDDDGCVVQ